MQRLIFEQSPYFIALCLGAGAAYAYLLYNAHYSWSKQVNQLLFLIRAIVVSVLAFLLLGPVIKLVNNTYEKPAWVFLLDNSASVSEVMDSVALSKLNETVVRAKNSFEESDYQVEIRDLADNEPVDFQAKTPSSDLSRGIQNVVHRYEGRNLGGIVLISDGIYNSGISPLFSPTRVPIYTMGIGDTTERVDVVLKNVDHNKVAYQGNKFPLKAQVYVQGINNVLLSVTISRAGKVISSKEVNSEDKSLLEFEFLLDANEKGMQRYDLTVKPLSQESNTRNNYASVFIEVIEGKKKILLVAPAPHPDIKTIRSVLEKNSNYEFIVHIPGVINANAEYLKPGSTDLIIFHQAIDLQGKTWALYNSLSKSNSSILLMIGSQSNLRQLVSNGIPLQFEFRGQWDDVTPVTNKEFRDFTFSEDTESTFVRYPPSQVPFGKFSFPAKSNILLTQRVGSVVTDRPLLFSWEEGSRKIGALVSEGVWRWRLSEYADNGNTNAFDELFSKLIQYLSTLDDKKRFKCFPLQNEFTDYESVVIESQVYNELYELIYGNTIELELRTEKGEVTTYNYTTSPGSSRYRIGGLKEGIYRFKASTEIGNIKEVVSGQFLVKAQNAEAQNLTADFQLLRKLADESGGKFYQSDNMENLLRDAKTRKMSSLIHTDESFNPLINLKWVFFLALALISIEWFVRKYSGGY